MVERRGRSGAQRDCGALPAKSFPRSCKRCGVAGLIIEVVT